MRFWLVLHTGVTGSSGWSRVLSLLLVTCARYLNVIIHKHHIQAYIHTYSHTDTYILQPSTERAQVGRHLSHAENTCCNEAVSLTQVLTRPNPAYLLRSDAFRVA